MSEIERREADLLEIRSVDERIIEARAVPYDTPTNVGGYSEQIARGAFAGTDPASVKLYWRHDEPVGRVLELKDKTDGLYMTAKFSDTTAGRDAWTLARDGVEHGVSIGFVPNVDEWNADKTRVIRKKATLVEVSTTDRPAYAGATILATREETTPQGEPMTDTAPAAEVTAPTVEARDGRVDEIVERMSGLESAMTTLAETRTSGRIEPMFRSFGEYIVARAKGDDRAEMLFRAIADNTIADNAGVLPESWLGGLYGLIDKGRPVANAFGVGRLSASGLTEHWPVVSQMPIADEFADDDTEVASQAFKIADESATIKTFAGGGNIARKLIDRSSPAYVDTIGRAMVAAYAKTTEADFVSSLITNATASTAFAGATLKDYVAGIANAAADVYEDSEFTADLLVVSRDVFIEWASLAASDGRPAFTLAGNGVNTAGVMNVPGLGGSFVGLPVLMSLSATTGTVLLASTNAAQFRESAGAPMSITKDDPSNLSRGLAVYGYGASAVFQPAAIRSIALD